MCRLIQLPPELLHEVLAQIEPEDLAAVSQTCWHLNRCVVDNTPLCRAIYLRVLDAPPLAEGVDWQKELRDLVRLARVFASRNPDKKSELPFVFDTVTRLLRNSARVGDGDQKRRRASRSTTRTSSRNASVLAGLFEDPANREAFLCRSFIFERARALVNRFQDPPKDEHQQAAKLHCLYGVAAMTCGRTRSSRMYPFACSKVYDLRQYTAATMWGPFMGDGSGNVDWERLEAIMLVLRSNIQKRGLDAFPIFSDTWNAPFPGTWPDSYVPMPVERLLGSLETRDPYDVSGTWLRMVCFLDYSDFFNYNFPFEDSLPYNVPRPAREMSEAARLILMKIHVTEIEEPGEDDGHELPVVHFRGLSRSLDGQWDENANSDLRGSCRLTREGEVRWTTYSIYNGEERWRSEGIQVGGPRAARGVIGTWFDINYDPSGPCGPTAFWKISDRKPKSDDEKIQISDFLPLVDGGDENELPANAEPTTDSEGPLPDLDVFADILSD